MFDRFAVFLLKARIWLIILVIGLATFLASSLVPLDGIRFDFSFRRLFQFDGEEGASLTHFKSLFGDDAGGSGILYLARTQGGHRPASLHPEIGRSIRRLHRWLENREELDQSFTISVLSATDFYAEPVQPEALERVLPADAEEPPLSASAWAAPDMLSESLIPYETVIRRISAHNLYEGMLLAADGQATALHFRFNLTHNHPSSRRAFLADLDKLVQSEQKSLSKLADLHTYGIPVVTEEYTRLSVQDIIRTAPLSILMMTLFLFLLFRSATAVILPQIVILFAVVSAIGFMQWTDEPLNIISHIVPVIVLVVGVADGVHILSRYAEERSLGAGSSEAVRTTVARLSKACFLTSTTTAIGFASLTTATIATIASFGLYTAIAVMFTYVVNMTLLPIGLSYTNSHPREPRNDGWLMRFLEATARFAIRNARSVFVGSLLFSAAAVVFVIFGLDVNSHLLEEVPPSNRVYQATKTMETHLSPVIPHELLVEGVAAPGPPCTSLSDCRERSDYPFADNLICITTARTRKVLAPFYDAFGSLLSEPETRLLDDLRTRIDSQLSDHNGICVESIKDPRLLQALDRISDSILSHPVAGSHVRRIESLAAVVKQMHRATRRNHPESDSVPNSRQAVAQLLLPIESANQELLDRYATLDYDATRLTLLQRDHGSSAWHEVKAVLEAGIEHEVNQNKELQGRFKFTITGTMTFVDKALSFIVHDMLLSVSTAFLFIFLLMVLLFRSLRIGLLSALPNIFPLVTTLLLMAVAGIQLRTATIIIFSISLGIAVNDTIHFIARYKEELERGTPQQAAIVAAMRSAGKAMVTTTLILAGGFLIDLISEFVALQQFGYLASFTLLMALIGDLLVLPACLILFDKP